MEPEFLRNGVKLMYSVPFVGTVGMEIRSQTLRSHERSVTEGRFLVKSPNG